MKNTKAEPPKWAVKFLEMICPDYLFEEIEGDLIQKYNKDLKMYSATKSRRRFIWNALRFFRPGIVLRNDFTLPFLPFYMLVNYFKVAFRVMLRNKAFSMINIAGLVFGITSALLLTLWIEKEFTYDQFHKDKDRIYKAWNRTTIDGEIQCWDRTPRILAPTLEEEFSSIENAVSYAYYTDTYLFSYGDKHLKKDVGIFTDPAFLTMFSFPLVKGNPNHVFDTPNSIILTERFARKLFGEKEAFGETVTVKTSGISFLFTVSGILKDLPPNTDFSFEYIIPFKFLESLEGRENNWHNHSLSTFVKIKEGVDASTLNEEIKDIAKSNSRDENSTEIFLYPFERMHMYGRFQNGVESGGRIEIMRMLSILGVCLVLIACINFINLSTARAKKRAKEVGVRKISGAYKYSIITQFICESVLISLIAGVVSLGLAYLLLPQFNDLIEQELSFKLNATFLLTLFFSIITIGVLAGSYPAVLLSSFRPLRILKGNPMTFSNRNPIRRILVVMQFGLAIMLIFSTIVIHNQINYVQNREIGFNKNNLIYHSIGGLEKNYNAYKNELLQSGLAESVTKTGSPITENWSNTWAIEWRGKDPENNKTVFNRFYIDDNFTKTAGIQLIAGRDISLDTYASDSTAVLLNETAVRIMGFEEPIGEIIKENGIEWHVVGVIEDFVLTSPYEKVKPMVLQGEKRWFDVVHIRLNRNNHVQQNLSEISTIFSKYNPDFPFSYTFVDADYSKKFASLEKTLLITSLFSAIIIFIACLGLFGLSLYITEGRLKEIGVRKVMGASVFGITKLLCISSIKPIIIAIILFSPLAWLAMSWWLQFAEYRISLNPWTLLLAAFALLTMALLTISTHTIKAARTNPVMTLRSE